MKKSSMSVVTAFILLTAPSAFADGISNLMSFGDNSQNQAGELGESNIDYAGVQCSALAPSSPSGVVELPAASSQAVSVSAR